MSRVCSVCGKVMKAKDTFCIYCGNVYEDASSSAGVQNSLVEDYSYDDTFDTFNYGPGMNSLGYSMEEKAAMSRDYSGGYAASGYTAGGYAPGYYGSEPVQKSDGMAVASMICSLVGLVLFFTVLCPIILGILGMALGGPSLYRISSNPRLSGKGLAIAGIIMGIIDIAIIVGLYFLGRYLNATGYYYHYF